ncbi:MAG: succinate dehydrogenase, cytochrome b556 subunit [Alsobacter sp.]
MADPTPAADRLRVSRPLSPHIQIFKPIFSMMMSIVHRLTGGALYVGTILLALWLVSAASGKSGFDSVQWFMGSFLGRLILFGYTWALLHHMLGGIKHLVWDTGAGFGVEARDQMNRWSLIGSVVLTILVWIVGYSLR